MIQTGICSYGMSGKLFHAPFIASHPGFSLAAIVERSKDDAVKKYPGTTIYRGVEELLADQNIELVVVNTPVQTHYDFAKAALEAGKHVIMEKPMLVHAKDADVLLQLAEKNNLLLSVYQNRRYDGDYLAVKKVIDQKLLGDIREVEIRFDRYRPGLSGKQHKEGTEPGAGNLYDLGPHIIDQALQLFGWPHAVFADVWTMRENVPSDDFFEILMYYPDKRIRLKGTVMARESYYAYVVHGNKGTFLQQRSDLQEQQLLEGVVPTISSWCKPLSTPDGLLHTEMNGNIVRQETFSAPGNYMGYYEDIYQCLTAGAANPVPATEAKNNIRIIEAAMQSATEKCVIPLS